MSLQHSSIVPGQNALRMDGSSDSRVTDNLTQLNASPEYGASNHYQGEAGRKYFEDQSAAGQFKALINRHKFAHLIEPHHTVVDFGCGGGFLLTALSCSRRIGVEINPYARAVATSLGLECYADGAEVPLGIADVVVTDHALEHVPFPIGALKLLRGALKPGGLLAVCVPNDNWYSDRVYKPNDRNHHLHSWTVQQFGNTLEDAGFDILRVETRHHCWPGRWTVACYGRLPLWAFDGICWMYCLVSGLGRQVFAVAKRPLM